VADVAQEEEETVVADQHSELEEFVADSNYSHVVGLSSELLKRYDTFLTQTFDARRRRLNALTIREQLLAFAFILAAIGAVGTICLALVLLSMNHPKYVVLVPFATMCLAALAILLRQFQIQTQRRAEVLTNDIRAEELIRSAIAAYLDSRETVSDRQAIEQLTGALMALQAAQVTGRASGPDDFRSPSVAKADSSLAWDPISIFLRTP
jgi:hypothetical protein